MVVRIIQITLILISSLFTLIVLNLSVAVSSLGLLFLLFFISWYYARKLGSWNELYITIKNWFVNLRHNYKENKY